MSTLSTNATLTENGRKKRSILTTENKKIFENMVKDNKKPTDIANILGISLSTVHKNIAKFHKCQEEKTDFKMNIKSGKKQQLEPTQIETKIMEIIQEDCSLTQRGIIIKLNENDLHCAQSTVSALFKKNEITRKRLKLKTAMSVSSDVVNQRKVYARTMMRTPDSVLLFLDETGFNLHTSTNYGYSPKNLDALKVVPTSKGKNISVVAIISNDQIAHHKSIDGAYNAILLEEFLQECLDKSIFKEKSILVLDNVRFHHTASIELFLTTHAINFKFLPTYSPQLNPIENVFSMIKSRYNAVRPRLTTSVLLKKTVDKVIRGINRSENIQMCAFYTNMRRYMDLAYQGYSF